MREIRKTGVIRVEGIIGIGTRVYENLETGGARLLRQNHITSRDYFPRDFGYEYRKELMMEARAWQ